MRLGTSSTTPLPEGEAKVRAVRSMFDTIAPRYDLLNRLMTFGLDRAWRRRAVRSLELPPGSRVLDLACGTGDLCRELAADGHVAVGLDMSWGMLDCARAGASLVQGDALALPFATSSFDGVVSGFALRNFVALTPVFSELSRVLRPGGRAGLLDVSQPDRRLLRAGHALYFGHVVPRIGAALSDPDAYRYLPKSLSYLPPVPAMLRALGDAGFQAVQRTTLSGGITQLVTATKLAA